MKEQVITSGNRTIVILDNSNWLHASSDPLLPFALDELLCKQAAKSRVQFCHIWRHPNAFILGQQDARLPAAQDTMEWIESQQYTPIVRNSGGAAVPLDEGVVNISLIFPILQENRQHFHKDFEVMFELIAAALSPFRAKVNRGEIAGGYCPGDFDLSIHGLKFCGIAQRRQIKAYSVQAFVNVSGSGSSRAALVRQFYERAGKNAAPGSFPIIVDNATASLEELLPLQGNTSFSLSSFIEALKQAVIARHHGNDQSEPVLNDRLEIDQIEMSNANNYNLPDLSEITTTAERLRLRYIRT